MKILDYYIIKKFLGTFFYAIFLLITIVIIFDVSENIDEFIEKNAPLDEIIFSYYLNFIPYFINLFSYLFTFIAVIFFTSQMASNSEIISILSSGISFYRLLRPYIISALILAIMSFYLSNFLIPKTNIKRRVFKDKYIEGLSEEMDKNIHLQIYPGLFVYLEKFNSSTNDGYKFTLENIVNNSLKYKLTADKIQWDSTENKWILHNYFIRTIDSVQENITSGIRMDTVINLSPSDLFIQKEDFEEMNFWQLNEHIRKNHLKGSKEVKFYEMEKQKRIASPFATIVLTLIGMSLSSRKIRGGIGMHLGLGITFTFTFILFMKISSVFSTVGNLSPVLAAWIPNIIFGIIGIILIRLAPK
ncbi:MAG: LptF/LptG family permease [Bacteroidetes bacterium]|nr:LptF/LptG family permease [Bacteroidota bacterium]